MQHPALGLDAERYVLGELSGEEREAFEEHCFSCPQCAAELRRTSAFIEAARRELAHAPSIHKQPAARSRWKTWATPAFLSPALAAMVIMVVGYHEYSSTRLAATSTQSPEALPVLTLVGGTARAGSGPNLVLSEKQSFVVLLDVPSEKPYTHLQCSLLQSSGGTLWELELPPQALRDSVSIRVPASLAPGSYTLIVRGWNKDAKDSADLAHYPFSVARPINPPR